MKVAPPKMALVLLVVSFKKQNTQKETGYKPQKKTSHPNRRLGIDLEPDDPDSLPPVLDSRILCKR